MIKRFFVIIFMAGHLVMFLYGCAEKSPIPPKRKTTESEATKPKTTKPGMIEHMTGSQQMKVYQKTKSKLDSINETLKKRYDEVSD